MEPNNQNKQASKQYRTRDIEIENRLTVTKGERRDYRGKGEVFAGTIIKDTWTIIRGGGGDRRGRGEERGEGPVLEQ